MNKPTKHDLKYLILESLQELHAKLKRKKDDEDKKRVDLRQDPLWLDSKGKYLLFDEEQPDECANVLELNINLEDVS